MKDYKKVRNVTFIFLDTKDIKISKNQIDFFLSLIK